MVIRGEPAHAAEIADSEQFAGAADDADATNAAKSRRTVPEAWRNKGFRFSVITAAFILAAGLSFGAGRVFGLGNTEVLSAIPAPLRGDDIFVEDQEGIAQDNLSSILRLTGQGMVHVLSGGTSVRKSDTIVSSAAAVRHHYRREQRRGHRRLRAPDQRGARSRRADS